MMRVKEVCDLIKNDREKKIILCCGCFEVFHIGHLEYLHEAKKLGDILIVGINADDYIRKFKQREPLFNIEQRIEIISSLSIVDYVFVFEEDDCSNAIMVLKPDVFVKGIDRKFIAERQLCIENGVEVASVGTKKIFSSTQLRTHIQSNIVCD